MLSSREPNVVDATQPTGDRAPWRSVTIPSEHGGWGLTLEPVLLGLLVAPSLGGVALGVAAFLAFVVRTPLKLAAVDARRDRWLSRDQFAVRLASVELLAIAALVALAVMASGRSWLVPVGIAAPFVAVEMWFDIRSRGRRLIPELCGAVGISSVAAAIVVASGRHGALPAGVWLVLAARSVGAIPFVRTQIFRLRRGVTNPLSSDGAQVAAVAISVIAFLVERRMLAGLIGVIVLGLIQIVAVRRAPVAAKQLGLRLMMLGLALVAVTAIGVLA